MYLACDSLCVCCGLGGGAFIRALSLVLTQKERTWGSWTPNVLEKKAVTAVQGGMG